MQKSITQLDNMNFHLSWDSRLHHLPYLGRMPTLFFLFFFFFVLLFQGSTAQNATLDPSEAEALNSIFQQWDTQSGSLWNISGEPCTGSAISGSGIGNTTESPAITCDCTYNNFTICHITQLEVSDLNRKGEIPEELALLTYLTYLKIDKNYFTGPLPSFIGNLSKLQVLSLDNNALNGTIPMELGNLKELTVLSLSSNDFSGTLPPKLGDLVNLRELHINSLGVGGEIPSTFANLVNMQVMWASDCPLNGTIPSFIGNWTNLTSLRFQGNSFKGPIPSSFSKLTSLSSMRISDLLNVSSSLDFIKDLKNLKELILRNALITGSIPSYIGDFQSLQTLDLSFNKLTGGIPTSLFNLSSLANLFLGNNSLFGTLPAQKSKELQIIDLSYNELSGSFPSWVTSDLQLNLVANNFVFDSSNISRLPGLNCLQRNFHCDVNTSRYNNFAIKCGAAEMRNSEGIVFEADDWALGAASYYITSARKWAVSNVGLFSGRSGASYIDINTNPIFDTKSPELFQNSRISPGSLRYYGLNLENGPYTVTLEFAETVFRDRSTKTWSSLARRVFDIYVQGALEFKDFDISKEAGGVGRALEMKFNASVSNNHLEIHLFWAGKGTCCNPRDGYYGPSISALSVASDSSLTAPGIPPIPPSEKNTGLIVGVTVSVGVVSLMVICVVLYLKRKASYFNEDEDFLGIYPRPKTFSYSELRTATEDFSPANKLGEGGYGAVYKGTLNDGRVVAVKQLSVASRQGKSQFVAEVSAISAVQHRNLVKLYGCCTEGNRWLLVYEYHEHKSLDQTLFGKKDLHLDWSTRFNICLGTAGGLAYLHEDSRPRIVHRDVKASNILLDAELCPKISDFGLAKLYDDKKTHISTRVAGTIGYLAPEYAMRGHLTEKADVFGFGVVALEILSGRPNSDNSLGAEKKYLLEWAWNLHENNRSLELVDQTLTAFDEAEARRVIGVALLCTQGSPVQRPTMSRVVAMLAGDIEVGIVTAKPSYLTDWDFEDITNSLLNDGCEASVNSESREHNGTSYQAPSPVNPSQTMLNELNREGR